MNQSGSKPLAMLALALLAGCSTYQPAVIADGVISNPTVGWAGYSAAIPEGLEVIYPLPADELSERAIGFQEWYDDNAGRWTGDYYNTFAERVILENPDRTYKIIFLSETYELRAGWSMLTSVESQYVINKMINRKRVVINDDEAFGRYVDVNGQRGWFVSGTNRPYSKKGGNESAYEGCYIIGGLKEVFWIEGFGKEDAREEMRQMIGEMAQSLEIHEVND